MNTSNERPAVVVLSTADYFSSVWTNKQHLALGLVNNGYTVQYIESMGLRRPTLAISDLSRIYGRLRRSRRNHSSEKVPSGLEIIKPPVIPYHGWRIARRLNEASIRRFLLPRLQSEPGTTLWTFSPMTYGIEEHFDQVVYHSVDLVHHMPAMPSEALLEAEKHLIHAADHVVASSSGVAEHLESVGATSVRLWENVAAVDIFSAAFGVTRSPTVLFAGNLTPTKVDFALLSEVANQPGINLRIAGPISIDGTTAGRHVRLLFERKNVEYLGNLSPKELAIECGRASVGLIPYLRNSYSAGVFPLKVYEYLAAGMTVVSTRIHSLQERNIPGVAVVDACEFANEVKIRAFAWNVEQARAYSQFASDHSWPSRIEQVEKLIHKTSSDGC
ncbi:glycosyltransferase [Gordonia sp. NPDC003424]